MCHSVKLKITKDPNSTFLTKDIEKQWFSGKQITVKRCKAVWYFIKPEKATGQGLQADISWLIVCLSSVTINVKWVKSIIGLSYAMTY